MAELADRVALVADAGSRVGGAIVRALAGRGAAIACAGADEAALAAAAEEVTSSGGRAVALPLDLQGWPDPAAAESVVAAAAERLGGLDLLAIGPPDFDPGPFTALTDPSRGTGAATAVIALIRAFAARACAAATTELAEAETAARRSVSVTVEAGFAYGEPGASQALVYAGALVGLVRGLARELGPYGMAVNAVAVGPLTVAGDDGVPTERAVREEMTRPLAALGRLPAPDDVAEAHAFLAGADGVSGVVLPVTGGLLGTSAL